MFCIDCVLGERVQDITFWKTELNNEIRAMENETDNLKVEFTLIKTIGNHSVFGTKQHKKIIISC